MGFGTEIPEVDSCEGQSCKGKLAARVSDCECSKWVGLCHLALKCIVDLNQKRNGQCVTKHK